MWYGLHSRKSVWPRINFVPNNVLFMRLKALCHMFSLYFDYLKYIRIFRFGFEGCILALIGSFPDLCIFFT